MEDLTPLYRIEYFLDAIVNGTVCPYSPLYRVEYYLAKLAGSNVAIPEPLYRIEFYLAKLCGEDVAIPEPLYRNEFYLAAACGEDVEIPEPLYRIEYWLNLWASNLDWATFTGSIIQFNAKKAHAVQSCTAEIEPVQDLSNGDPSPTNICPISGHTEVDVYARGKNLLDDSQRHYANGNVYFGGATFNTQLTCVLPAGTYTYTVKYNGINTVNIYAKDIDAATNISGFPKYGSSSSNTCSQTFTLTETTRISFWTYSASLTSINDVDYAQIELGSTATAYEAYQGNTYTIDLDGTRYGGTVDLVTGVLTVTEANIASYAGETLPSTWISDRDVYAVGTTPTTGAQVVYTLATPLSIQLTAQEVEALKGQNTMWADTGDITVVARGEAIQLNGLQLMRTLLGSSYVNNNTEEDISDEEAASILLGGTES